MRITVLPIGIDPSHLLRNVLKQCKDAKQATAVLDTVPQPILVPSPKNITIPPKQDNQIRNMKPHASISDTRRKTSNVDLLRRRERLFRVGLGPYLRLALNLPSV